MDIIVYFGELITQLMRHLLKPLRGEAGSDVLQGLGRIDLSTDQS